MGAGLPPEAVLIIVLAALAWWTGQEIWHGLKWLWRHLIGR